MKDHLGSFSNRTDPISPQPRGLHLSFDQKTVGAQQPRPSEYQLGEDDHRRRVDSVTVDLAPEKLVLEGDADLRGGKLQELDVFDGTARRTVVGIDDRDHTLGSEHRKDH